MTYKVELNADLGESWYDHRVGADAAIMPLLDACNIACGFHGGDSLTQLRTVELAAYHGVAIGAHPSFPDRRNFGREAMQIDPERLYTLLLYQVAGLQGIVRSAKRHITHLKPHGALYHYADGDPDTARSIVRLMGLLDIPILYGPPGGELEAAAGQGGHEFYAEGFVDRRYEPTLHLRSRQLPDAFLVEPAEAARQALRIASEGSVEASDGKLYELKVRTLCLHGDHAGALERARAVHAALNPS